MTTRLIAKPALAVCAWALAGAAGIAMSTPADARVVIGFGVGPVWGYPYPYPYPYAYPYPYYAPPVVYSPPVDPGYAPDPGYAAAPAAAQGTWYYCNNPPGYYPYVQQCSTGWRAVPAQPQQ